MPHAIGTSPQLPVDLSATGVASGVSIALRSRQEPGQGEAPVNQTSPEISSSEVVRES